MPFGLCIAPATFRHFINYIFSGFLDIFVIVYLDDILIFSVSLDLHQGHVKSVLCHIRQHGLYAKPKKCEFELQSIQFLGLVISTEGIKMNPQKVSAILDWPAPTDKKGVQRFVGFANIYLRFIKRFSAIIAPHHATDKATHPIPLVPGGTGCLRNLNRLFTSICITSHPDLSLPYVLEVDASETTVSAVVLQRQGLKDLMHPVAFFSHKLSPAERNYDVGDRELPWNNGSIYWKRRLIRY